MKCVCHTFHLYVSYACMKLPRAVEDLARDVYNYFQCSPKCIGSLTEFQEFVDVKPHKTLHASQTRWLSLQAVVSRLLEQYGTLKLFFADAVFTVRLQAAETIFNMLENDPVQKLYLSFLKFVLEILNKLNRQMKPEKPQIHVLHTVMPSTVHTLLDCFISEHNLYSTAIENVQFRNPKYFLQLENVYLGVKVNALLAKGTYMLTKEALHDFRILLNPKCVLKKKLPSIAHLASKFPAIVTEDRLQSLDMEWRHLRNHKFDFDENVSAEEFWFHVRKLNAGFVVFATLQCKRGKNFFCCQHDKNKAAE
ncbi:hypothetical protein PR048_001665 [Dryococelus australis]|uniref:Transposase n=1 Tax=Dryococelus australis TaxID=614101 RepID=A0ABQ9II61_9NEOP|nr:hypothetical protein PR048_001665 [Dryococelus australis]